MSKKEIHSFQQISAQWICPITQIPMIDPVITCDGHTYEKQAIIKWFQQSNKSPVTGLPLQQRNYFPNIILKNIITSFKSFQVNVCEIVDTKHSTALEQTKQQLETKINLVKTFQSLVGDMLLEKLSLEQKIKELQKRISLWSQEQYQKNAIFRVKQSANKIHESSMKNTSQVVSKDEGTYLFGVFLTNQQVSKRYTKDYYLNLYNLGIYINNT